MERICFNILLADIVIELRTLYGYTKLLCDKYITDKTAQIVIETQYSDIEFEKQKSADEDRLEGIPLRHFDDDYLESLSVYRKIATKLVDYGIVLFHGSCISVDGNGYLFTAKSGVGKSTHARLWRKQFGSRFVYVNDDKPLLKITDDGVFAYGTPWDGKHRLSSNICVPLKGICVLHRGTDNSISRASVSKCFPQLMVQVYRPSDKNALGKTLALMSKLVNNVAIFELYCNMNEDAAAVAYNGMK